MPKTKTNPSEKQALEAQRSETDRAKAADATDRDQLGSDFLAVVQTGLSLKTSGLSDENSAALQKAAVARYREFAPSDASERTLASLIVGLQNGSMTSLQAGASTECPHIRNDEMRNAIHAAETVADLLEKLDRHRGRGHRDVRVGQVNVETGAQAIVGNVTSDGRRPSPPEEPDDPTDNPSRAKE
jgi:hypothetical protein